MVSIVHIISYEIVRYLRSSRIYFLFLVGTLPILVFLAFSAESAKLEILAGGLEAFQITLILGYIFFTYIVSILICIVVFSDLVGNENAFEYLLISTRRSTLLIGKIFASYIILFILVIESFLGFIIVLFSYNVPIPPLKILIDGILITFLSAIVLPSSVCLFASTFALRFNYPSSIASYISIFFFFIIPFIIYFSYFQIGLIQLSMLELSIHTYYQEIIVNFFSNQISLVVINPYILIGSLSGICYLFSFLLFLSTPIYH